jgi:Lon protease-like protein
VTPIPNLIPLFPLPNVVLFPRMSLPLHVFEPRYRKMVGDVLNGHKTIGMALLRPGWEADYHGRPPIYSAGCAGVLEQWEPLEHGRYNILLKGVCRFRIVEEHAGEPYRLATVRPQPEEPGDPPALEVARNRVLAAIAKAADGPQEMVLEPELPYDVFVNAVCQSLALEPVERQSLLDCDSILARYTRLLEILDFRLLEQTLGRGGVGTVH